MKGHGEMRGEQTMGTCQDAEPVPRCLSHPKSPCHSRVSRCHEYFDSEFLVPAGMLFYKHHLLLMSQALSKIKPSCNSSPLSFILLPQITFNYP